MANCKAQMRYLTWKSTVLFAAMVNHPPPVLLFCQLKNYKLLNYALWFGNSAAPLRPLVMVQPNLWFSQRFLFSLSRRRELILMMCLFGIPQLLYNLSISFYVFVSENQFPDSTSYDMMDMHNLTEGCNTNSRFLLLDWTYTDEQKFKTMIQTKKIFEVLNLQQGKTLNSCLTCFQRNFVTCFQRK